MKPLSNLLGLGVLAWSSSAVAAGFDTPILYTARHQGMGGTAIGFVDDPSAGFHNPAGLQHTQGLSLIGDVSLLFGEIQGVPSGSRAVGSIDSELTIAPFFLAGAAYRVHPWLSVGAALLPVASGGASYEYESGGRSFEDETQIVFLEATPFASLNFPEDAFLPGHFSVGAGFRFSQLSFGRVRGTADTPNLDLDMSGSDASGVRLGLQHQPNQNWSWGLVFRNRVKVTAKTDSATVLAQNASDGELTFTLPAKFGAGASFKTDTVRIAIDAEYALQEQNREAPLSGVIENQGEVNVDNVFRWQNGFTARLGLEYSLGPAGKFPLRVGYVLDTRVTNPAYPSAFGTPPAETHTATAGAGVRGTDWESNLALAYRFGGSTVTEEEFVGCAFCGFEGDYSLKMLGVYLDASINFDL